MVNQKTDIVLTLEIIMFMNKTLLPHNTLDRDIIITTEILIRTAQLVDFFVEHHIDVIPFPETILVQHSNYFNATINYFFHTFFRPRNSRTSSSRSNSNHTRNHFNTVQTMCSYEN